MSVSKVTASTLEADENAAGQPPRHVFAPSISLQATFLAMALVLIGAAFVLGVNPGDKVTLPLIPFELPSVCQFRNMTGWDCPGCGLSRAFIHIAHGDVWGALKYNPASVLVFAFVLAQIPYRSAQIWRISRGQDELRWHRVGNWALAIVVAVLIGQWVVKTVWMLLR